VIDILTRDVGGSWRAGMHHLRYRVFKQRLRWSVTAQDGLEVDRYDDLNPVYLIARDDDGTVDGCWRLLSTTGPYMLRDVFPDLLGDMAPPASPTILEGSRLCVAAPADTAGRIGGINRITSELFCALVEHCIAVGVREVLTVYDVRIARLLPRIGCRPTWQSGLHRIGPTLTLAGRFDTDGAALKQLQRHGGITGSVVRSAPWLHQEKVA